MNCKPNELAVISRPPNCLKPLLGRVVRVLRLIQLPSGRLSWQLERLEWFVASVPFIDGYRKLVNAGEECGIDTAADAWLTPLRGDPEPESIDTPAELEAATFG